MKLKNALALLMLYPCCMYAQDVLYNRGGELYLQKHAMLMVQGNIINDNTTSSGAVYNDGTIELTGNIENKEGAKFKVHTDVASKERAVKFVGVGKQLIKGNFSTAGESSFFNLVIDKINASDTVEMQTEVVVEGSLSFGSASVTTTYNPEDFFTNHNQKGLLKTFDTDGNEHLLNVTNGSPDAIAGYPVLEIEGGPSTGFILTKGTRGSSEGGLQRNITSATSYVFPVGTSDKGFNAVMLNFSAVPGNGSVKTKFCNGTSNPNGSVGTISYFCEDCSGKADNNGYNRFFPSNPCNGGEQQWLLFDHTASNHGYWSFESSNEGYQYDMEVFPNSFGEEANRNSAWRVLKHEAEYGDDPSLETVDWMPEIERNVSDVNDLLTFTKNMGCYNGNGVPGGTYTDFSHFAMGFSQSGGALPVKLLYVRADPMGKHRIRVSWATAIEINNAGFDVERSIDGINFTKIGWVDGHNNSTETKLYSFEDRAPAGYGIFYYRLKQIDYDEKYEYSYIVQAKIGEGGGSFELYPNPTSSTVFINVKNPQSEITVRLYDLKGAQVFENIFPVETDGVDQTVAIKLSAILPPGTYLLTAGTNGASVNNKVVLQ
ncbi:MAG: T9SS type A sorting domain-containing protein [Chitinophagales bacterium]|nr:T9SS type A sorting domain-containing protein [Chitinophagales bacterium]